MKKLTEGLTTLGLAMSSIGICLFMIVGNRLWGGILLGVGFALSLASVVIHYYHRKKS